MPKTNRETKVTNDLLPKFQAENPTARVFRNNTGMAINKNGVPVFFGVGKPVKRNGKTRQVGGGDFIGWKTVEITPDMVGGKIAIFMSVEAKTKTGRLSRDQRDWAWMVEHAGGIVVILQEDQK
jgi:hypothetical protein